MPIFITCLLKTIICSAILFTYYRAALYNRTHHQWNRLYLLTALVISFVIPFIHIPIPETSSQTTNEAIQMLNVVNSGAELVQGEDIAHGASINTYSIVFSIYLAVAIFFLFILLFRLLLIWKLFKRSPRQKLGSVNLVMTQEKNAPFSFFNNIFWNTQIDIDSEEGKDILRHELTHVREWHSADRLLMNVAVAICWCNPIFWLMKKEICQLHEFLADQKSVSGFNLSAFSRLVLRTTYPNHQFKFTSHFFSSPIKRRFLMLTKQQNPTSSPIRRWMALPVMIIIFAGFTFKKDTSLLPLGKTITVVIDAGHGGESAGAVATDGTKEKDLNLSIAKRIVAMNSNNNLKIILTRETDVKLPLKELVSNVVKQHPDAFISIHVNSGQQNYPGFEFYISARNENYGKESQLLGSLVSKQISSIYKVAPELKRGNNDKGIWVLDAPERNYPALLVECGNIANGEDLSFLKSSANQDKIAHQLLKALAEFAAGK